MLRQDSQHLNDAEHAITTLWHCKEVGVGYLYLVIPESVSIVVIFKVKLNVASDIPVVITLRLRGAREWYGYLDLSTGDKLSCGGFSKEL